MWLLFLVKPPYPPVKLFGGDRIIMIMIRQIILNPNFVESKWLQLEFHEKPFTSSKFHENNPQTYNPLNSMKHPLFFPWIFYYIPLIFHHFFMVFLMRRSSCASETWQVNINGFIRCHFHSSEWQYVKDRRLQRSKSATSIQMGLHGIHGTFRMATAHGCPPHRTRKKIRPVAIRMIQGWRRQHERPGGPGDHIHISPHITMVTLATCGRLDCRGQSILNGIREASHVSGKCSGVQQFNTKMSWHISPLHLKSDLIQLDGWPAGHLVRRVPTSWRSHKWSISVLRSRCWVLTYHKQIVFRLHGRHDIITMYGPRSNVNYQIIIYYNIEKYIYYNIKR